MDSPRAIFVCGCLSNVDFCERMKVGIPHPPSRWCHLCLVDKWDNYCQYVTKHLTNGMFSERLATINIPIVNALSFDSAKPPRIILMDLPNSFYFFFHFFFIVVDFVIHWNETAMGLHVFPIPIPPPTSLSTCSLWVFPVHQVRVLVSCIQPGLVICFTPDSIHVSMLFSWNIPPSPSPTESKRLFYTSVPNPTPFRTYDLSTSV